MKEIGLFLFANILPCAAFPATVTTLSGITIANPLRLVDNRQEWEALGFDCSTPELPCYAALDGRHRTSILLSRWNVWLEKNTGNLSPPPALFSIYATVLNPYQATDQNLKR